MTGSKHLLEVGGKKILLDCGMFQGHRREAEAKNKNLPVDPKTIDVVVLSHAHLDHCGSLPTMYNQGFRGKIISTPATRDVAELILLDSAYVQESDNKHIAGIKRIEPEPPLYTAQEVTEVMKQFAVAPYHQEFSITNRVKGLFKDAGHILGSAVVELTIKTGLVKNLRLGFTGDLGRTRMPILRDPEGMHELDTIIIESTYGDRLHESFAEAKRVLKKYVLAAVQRNAKIVVPSFALGRTQELIYVLHELTDSGEIPRFPIYVDSPLAINITDIFKNHPECYDQETWQEFGRSDNPFGFRNLEFTLTTEESMFLNKKKGPMMIISAAGMCEGGRVRHHLKNCVEDYNNMVMITGFMAKNTLGRKIVEQHKQIKIFDNMYKLRAQVIVMNAFSAHADAVDLVSYISQAGTKLKNIFIVHGEASQSQALKDKLVELNPGYQVKVPEFGETVKI